MTVCLERSPQRVAPTPVLDPELTHVCIVCDHVDNEDTPFFDMSHCAWVGGWIDRECHLLSGCRDPLCDPTHI